MTAKAKSKPKTDNDHSIVLKPGRLFTLKKGVLLWDTKISASTQYKNFLTKWPYGVKDVVEQRQNGQWLSNDKEIILVVSNRKVVFEASPKGFDWDQNVRKYKFRICSLILGQKLWWLSMRMGDEPLFFSRVNVNEVT